MIVIDERKYHLFKIKYMYFSHYIFDVPDCDVAVFLECKEKFNSKGFIRRERVTSVIDLTQDLDEIWGNMKKKSCRYAIKRAQRDGIEIEINEHFDEFYQIYETFVQQKGLNLRSPQALRRYGTLFIAKLNDEILGGHLYLEDEEVIMYWKSASKRPAVDREKAILIGNASHLLHWEAIKYAKGKGIKEFNMGGLIARERAGHPRHSIDAFKESFGGERVIRYSYQKSYNKVYALGRYLYHLLRGG